MFPDAGKLHVFDHFVVFSALSRWVVVPLRFVRRVEKTDGAVLAVTKGLRLRLCTAVGEVCGVVALRERVTERARARALARRPRTCSCLATCCGATSALTRSCARARART